jgi:hypothetical protein
MADQDGAKVPSVVGAAFLFFAFAVAGCGSSGTGSSGTGSSLSCYGTVGSQCVFSRTSNQSSCPTGDQEGSCPAAGLLGCCVTNLMTSEETQTLAVCVYTAADEASEKATCAMDPGGLWQTTLP